MCATIRNPSTLILVVVGVVSLLGPAPAADSRRSSTEKQRRAEATALVAEALHREIYGSGDDRAQMLDSAVALAPADAAVRWHTGHVRYRNRWVRAEDLPQIDELQKRLRQYERRRSETPATAAGLRSLAEWCREHKLPEQERAHLYQVLQLAPGDFETRFRLGHRLVEGRWIEGEAMWSGLRDTQQTRAAIDTWAPTIQEIAGALESRSQQKREAAAERLLAISDVEAIPAMEILTLRGERAGSLVVQSLSQMPEHQASLALARIAVLSPLPALRDEAAQALRGRSYDGYIPQLLDELKAPIASRIESGMVNGRLLYRHAMFQEGQERNQSVILDRSYARELQLFQVSRRGLVSVNPNQPLIERVPGSAERQAESALRESAAADMQATARQREVWRIQQNAWIQELNGRICGVLQTSTGQQLPPRAEAWWQWWDQQNEVSQGGPKQTDYRYARDAKQSFVPAPVFVQRHECFIAGTPVWTTRGPKPIEKVLPGDLVLSQHPETGNLSCKPVLATTVRPAEELLVIRTAVESLEASGGHPLWVSGEGWVLARELESGMVLHGLQRGVPVSNVEPGSRQTTYNLIVDDFHTYFVGEGRVLCHDNTPRRPTNAVVPGLLLRN